MCARSILKIPSFPAHFTHIQLTLQAKKAAEDASKQALQASKQAADASKNTFDDLTYVGKSTIGDLTKTAKEAATKKGLMKGDSNQMLLSPQSNSSGASQTPGPNNTLATQNSGNFFSSFGNDFNGIASSTSSMFSDLFGKSNNRFSIFSQCDKMEGNCCSLDKMPKNLKKMPIFVAQNNKAINEAPIKRPNKSPPKRSCCRSTRSLAARRWSSARH